MKNDCSIVKDLIPLYAESLLSSETEEFICEHCQSCEKCKNLLDSIVNSHDSNETTDYKKEKIWNEIAIKERKKRRIRYILLSFAAMVLITASVFNYSFMIKGNTWFAKYDCTYTEQTTKQSNFSEKDIRSVAEEVKRYFQNNFGGCVLLSLTYDEKSTLNKDWHEEYPEAIIFKSDYYMLKEPVAGDPNRDRHNWEWIVIKDNNNQWKVVGSGYC